MKNFIYKTNQYLLERHPNLWNTKLLWMVGVAVIIHILFYIIGLLALSNPASLHEYNAIDIFFKNGMISISVIISILMIVGWLVYVFKNNAFKSFYPTSTFDILKQFASFFVIILVSTSFYYSYKAGIKTYINNTYNDQQWEHDIDAANNAALFFSHNIYAYQLNNKIIPARLQELYCETDENLIDYNQSHLSSSSFNNYYQYYTLKTITRDDAVDEYVDSIYDKSVFHESDYKNNTTTYYFKDEVVDASSYIETVQPSYYNYSNVFYKKGEYYNYYNPDYAVKSYSSAYKEKPTYSSEKIGQSQYFHELLDRNNPQEIKDILERFLKVAKAYKIAHNITSDQWFPLVYHPTDFQVKSLINLRKRDVPHKRIYDQDETLSPIQEYTELINTDYYIETQNLKQAFDNIHDIKTEPYIGDTIHVFIWLSFLIALVILAFRITGLKPLIFTVVAVGLLIMIILLISYFISLRVTGNDMEFAIMYVILFIGTAILLTTIFGMNTIPKKVAAVFYNITLIGFVPYVFLILGIISMHQEQACKDRYPGLSYSERDEVCFNFIQDIGLSWSWILLAIGFITMLWLANRARRWKSLPDG